MPGQLRQLVRLKLLLTYRLYSRSPLALVGLVISVGVLSFLSFGGLFFCLLLFEVLPEPQRTELLYLLLAAIYLLWVTGPLLGVSFNESYDLSKLFVYPIPYSRIFAGSVLGNLIDLSVLMMVPTLTSALVGFGKTWLQIAFIAAILFVYVVHTVSLSQILQLVMWGFLRSRRVRDFVLVFGSLFGVAFFLAQSFLLRGVSWQTVGWLALLWDSRPSQWLCFLPCGVAASGVRAASVGRWPAAVAALLALCALCVVTLVAAGFLVRQFHAGELEFGKVFAFRRRAALNGRSSRRLRPTFTLLHRCLPAPVTAIALKEFRYLLRDPYWKAYLIRALAQPLVYPLIMFLSAPRGLRALAGDGLEVAFFTVPAGSLLFSALILNANIFAIDREGLNLLFQFSCPRRLILLGKNLATYTIIGGTALATLGVVGGLTRRGDLLVVSLVGTLSLILLFFAAGNLISIFFPYRIASRGRQQMQPTSNGRGCMMMVINTLAYLGVVAVAIPPVLAIVLPYTFRFHVAYYAALPTVIVYCVSLYLLALNVAARQLLKREAEIIQAVRPEA